MTQTFYPFYKKSLLKFFVIVWIFGLFSLGVGTTGAEEVVSFVVVLFPTEADCLFGSSSEDPAATVFADDASLLTSDVGLF